MLEVTGRETVPGALYRSRKVPSCS